MKSDFLIAVTQLAAERSLPQDMVIEAVEAALVSAYKKDSYSAGQNISVRLDPSTGDVAIFQLKTVVKEVTDELQEITLPDAKKDVKKFKLASLAPKIDDVIEYPVPPHVAGRIAAQTAKQVVIQRLREAERELVYGEFSEREGEVFTGTVQRSDARYGGVVTLDLNGRAEAIIPTSEQVPYERYRPGMKLKVMIQEVRRTNRGPEIVASRSHTGLLKRLFEIEVPEIYNGIVEIRAISREAGSRSKVAVIAKQEGVDPVGACVGLRGIRIQNIVNELQGEKIDVVQWVRDPAVFISHALSPAQPLRVELDAETQTAHVVVSDRSLSLAIGRDGQNVRLAAKLTGWAVDIKSSTELEIERMKEAIEGQVAEREAAQSSEAETLSSELEEVEVLNSEVIEQEVLTVPDELEVGVAEVQVEEAEQIVVPVSDEELALLETGLSAEEELVLEALELDTAREIDGGEEIEVVAEESIWQVPDNAADSQIRFAEDIAGAPIGGRLGGKGRRKRRRAGPARRNTNSGAPQPNQVDE